MPPAAVSRRSGGQLRSISTLPHSMRRPRASAAAKKASTEWGWTVANTEAVVVPWASSRSTTKAALRSASEASAKRASAGNT